MKNLKGIFYIALACLLASPSSLIAQDFSFKARAGYSIGGTAPLGLPASIRSLDSFNLTPSFVVGGDAAWAFESGWGILSGLRFENKGMDAGVTTKGYRMEMVQGENRIEGLFYGHVKQQVTQWMLTLPVQATYKVGSVVLRVGPYASYLVNKDFSGIASDGYLRQGDPTGPKVIIGSTEGEWATYDFSDEVNSFQFGLGAGADWTITGGFGVSAELNWGLTGLLRSSFKTVEQTLYPIYGTIGIFYQFGK